MIVYFICIFVYVSIILSMSTPNVKSVDNELVIKGNVLYTNGVPTHRFVKQEVYVLERIK